MPPTSSKPPPLPLAPDRAAIANKISLLLSNRTSLLKTLNPSSSPTARQTTTRRHNVNADDIEQLFSGPRPNEGVGYVADRKAAPATEDRMLRRRLLGKGQRNGKGEKKRFAVESESDEEPGRSGLGKRKRRRREVGESEEVGEELGGDEVEDEGTGHVEDAALVLQQQEEEEEVMADSNGGDDAKRNKKKKKRQREKEKQKLKKLGNASS
ncbi:uncharacterized protein Triagg1_9614 [Trichoderma aggressivum f. europaeum]|uniref:Uncharacterized protein n=1 Tax=Trichoderma aggressivum f. europaeum TaxID=173218 RepID=A0AAE1LVF8_9HYPO|nr:hypothetical protein Triagg1_9614 [Trichoderma aggressivum f. europaeum]